MTTSTMPAQRRSILDRINPRMIMFVLIVSALPLCLAYMYVKDRLTQGIENYGDYAKVDLKAMGNFPFDVSTGTINDIPTRFRNLDGKKILLTGYMYSPYSAGPGLTQFQFVYNVSKCCFNGPPLVQERVFARTPNKTMVDYGSNEMVDIIGTLHVQPKKDDGITRTVYTLDVDKIQPAT